MILAITYKTENVVFEIVNYVHTEDEKLYFTVKENPTPAVQTPVIVPLENIKNFIVLIGDEVES